MQIPRTYFNSWCFLGSGENELLIHNTQRNKLNKMKHNIKVKYNNKFAY